LDELKNQFITSVNHELRTPLMTMQAYIELLRVQQQALPEATRATVIEEVGRTSDALVDLVQSILEIRRLDTSDTDFPRQAVPVYATLEKATALINPREGRMAERDLRVYVPQHVAIWGEAVRLQQILTNLLSNAIKYSPPGAPIEIGAQMLEPGKVPGLKRRQQRPMCEITVRDYGLGIPKDQMPLLFNRFVRLPRDLASNVVGSGLGLYLCRSLAEAMDGTIWAESSGAPGEGSIFHLVLPIAPAETKLEDEITQPRLAVTRRRA
jgi:signal transduction histidine kinase